MKYYQVMEIGENDVNKAVGANFIYCKELELKEIENEIESRGNNASSIDEISKFDYDQGRKRAERKAIYLMTGYYPD